MLTNTVFIHLKVKSLVEYEKAPISDAIAACMQSNQDVYVESKIQIRFLQIPFVVERCSKPVLGQKCAYRVSGGKCGKGHETSEFPSFLKIGLWIAFLDAETSSSVQRRCWVKTEAFLALTGIKQSDMVQMTPGFQELVANNLKDGIYVAKFIVGEKFIQLIEFVLDE